MEMWASEILDRLYEATPIDAWKFPKSLSEKRWTAPERECGLIQWLEDPVRVIDLYMVWLLLVDLLPLAELADQEQPTQVVEHIASPTTVASRQWYTTACHLLTQHPRSEPMLAVGLPGHFSTRRDWFLGVARGSKSDLLADRVLDIFSSRRNNLTRLYSGLGLPSRVLGTPKETERLLTALTGIDRAGKPTKLRYRNLLALGAPESKRGPAGGFHWLFRSALSNYHKHSRIFQRWNSRNIIMWIEEKAERGPKWVSGFEIYDMLMERSRPNDSNMKRRMERITKERRNTWTHFQKRCEILRDLLIHSDRNERL